MDQHWTLWSDIVRGHHIAIRQRQASKLEQGLESEAKFIEIDGKEVPRETGESLLSDAGLFDVLERYSIGSSEGSSSSGRL